MIKQILNKNILNILNSKLENKLLFINIFVSLIDLAIKIILYSFYEESLFINKKEILIFLIIEVIVYNTLLILLIILLFKKIKPVLNKNLKKNN